MMTALLLKDLLMVQRQMKSQAFLLVIFLFIAIFTQQIPILLAMIVFIVATQTITSLSYDEQSHWDQYVNTLPISKGEIVLSKYVLSILLMVIGLIIALPIVFIISRFTEEWVTADLFLTFNLIVALSLCMLALLLPIYIKFGSIKGRIVLITVWFIPSFLFGLLNGHLSAMTSALVNLKPYMFLAPFAGLFILWVSSLISTAIYKRKEF